MELACFITCLAIPRHRCTMSRHLLRCQTEQLAPQDPLACCLISHRWCWCLGPASRLVQAPCTGWATTPRQGWLAPDEWEGLKEDVRDPSKRVEGKREYEIIEEVVLTSSYILSLMITTYQRLGRWSSSTAQDIDFFPSMCGNIFIKKIKSCNYTSIQTFHNILVKMYQYVSMQQLNKIIIYVGFLYQQ